MDPVVRCQLCKYDQHACATCQLAHCIPVSKALPMSNADVIKRYIACANCKVKGGLEECDGTYDGVKLTYAPTKYACGNCGFRESQDDMVARLTAEVDKTLEQMKPTAFVYKGTPPRAVDRIADLYTGIAPTKFRSVDDKQMAVAAGYKESDIIMMGRRETQLDAYEQICDLANKAVMTGMTKEVMGRMRFLIPGADHGYRWTWATPAGEVQCRFDSTIDAGKVVVRYECSKCSAEYECEAVARSYAMCDLCCSLHMHMKISTPAGSIKVKADPSLRPNEMRMETEWHREFLGQWVPSRSSSPDAFAGIDRSAYPESMRLAGSKFRQDQDDKAKLFFGELERCREAVNAADVVAHAAKHGSATVVGDDGKPKVHVSIPTKDLPVFDDPIDPLDNEYDGQKLRDLIRWDERLRQDTGAKQLGGLAVWHHFTPAQRAAVSAHWSAQLRAKVAAEKKAERNKVTYCEEDEL